MKIIDLAEHAGKVFQPSMQVAELLTKLNIEAHAYYVEQHTKDLEQLLKVYDNPLECKPLLMKLLSAASSDLRSRGMVESPHKLHLV